MKLAIATRSDSGSKHWAEMTHPIIKKFAQKWGADFIILSEDFNPTPGLVESEKWPFMYRIVKIAELLETYDRILSLDTDLIINKSCPNIFDVVPEDMVGTHLQDWGPLTEFHRNYFKAIQKEWGDVGWKEGYPNSAVMVVSRQHKQIFSPGPTGVYWTGEGWDDIHFGWWFHKLGIKIFNLDYKFNHVDYFSKPEYGSLNRFNSHIIHWAGRWDRKEKRIKQDIEKIYGEKAWMFPERLDI